MTETSIASANAPEKIASESLAMSFVRVLGSPYLRTTALRCVASIFRHFFLAQSRAAFLPGLIPVSRADHPLDSKIPFWPGKVNIYLDFVAFWIRSVGFILRVYGRAALEPSRDFIQTMGQAYAQAAEVTANTCPQPTARFTSPIHAFCPSTALIRT